MKKALFIIPALLAALSCTKEEAGQTDILLMTESFNIDYAAQEIEFSYDIINPIDGAEVTVTTDADWVSVKEVGADGTKLSVTENKVRWKAREAELKLSYGDEIRKTFLLKQDYLKAAVVFQTQKATIDLHEQKVSAPFEIRNHLIGRWPTVKETEIPEWIEITVSGNDVESSLDISVTKNTSGESREFTVILEYPGAEDTEFTLIQDNKSYYEFIDGVKWATQNAGTDEENPYGKLYSHEMTIFSCPEGWRAPTWSELQALYKNSSDWTTEGGLQGVWFSGSKPYSEDVPAVFFPAGGYKKGGELRYFEERGCYISGLRGGYNNNSSIAVCFEKKYFIDIRTEYNSLDYMGSLRCVMNQ